MPCGAAQESTDEWKKYVLCTEVIPFQYFFHARRGEKPVQRTRYLLQREWCL